MPFTATVPLAVAEPFSPFKPPPYFYGAADTVYEVTIHEPNGTPRVPEALVQDLWRTSQFDTSSLVTTSGQSIRILGPGTLNTDSGPDFRNAHLIIADTEWHGDIEIHTTSSGWFDHKHQMDPRYNSVVLHVALHADLWTGGLLRNDGSTLPELILYPHLDSPLRQLLYAYYTCPSSDVLCASAWSQVPEGLKHSYIQRLARERLHEKTKRLAIEYLGAPDLEMLLHERLFAALGYAKNAEPMTSLARRLPYSLARSIKDPLDLEALHLGVANLLPGPADLLEADRATVDYTMDLHDRFDRLRHTHQVQQMKRTLWQFFRLRPANFPPLRIAQAAALFRPGNVLHRDPLGRLLAAARNPEPITALRSALHAQPGKFWDTHLRLEKSTPPRDPSIGKTRLNALLVNAVLPVLLLYAEQNGDPGLQELVYETLQQLPPERNEITRRYRDLGTRPESALAAQGLHQLYHTRCTQARCLSCDVGKHLMAQAAE